MTSLDYARLARKVQCASVEDMFAAIGSGELTAQGVMAIGETLVRPRQSQAQIEGLGDTGSLSRLSSWAGHRGRIHRAGCCNPVEGDRVGGFVTRARGVSVHRLDCSRWLKLVDMAPDRVVEVRWESGAIAGLDVTIEILAYDRRGLLRDITEALSLGSANMISVNTQTDRRTQMATLRLFLEVNGLAELDAVLERIAKLPNVISADRIPEEMGDD
jgi:GTP pyrophosphokinase